MKNKILLISTALTIIIFSCSKSQLLEDNVENPINKTKSDESRWSYYDDGSLVSSIDSAVDYEVAFVDGSTYTGYFFSNDETFLDWAADQSYYADSILIDLELMHQNIETISDYAFSSGAVLHYELYGYISNDMLDFMYAHGLPENTRIHIRQLYKEKFFLNSIHISGQTPMPTLGNANNKAQSLKQIGVFALNGYYDRTWFRKPVRYFYTLGGETAVPDLGVLNFNNKIESIFPFL